MVILGFIMINLFDRMCLQLPHTVLSVLILQLIMKELQVPTNQVVICVQIKMQKMLDHRARTKLLVFLMFIQLLPDAGLMTVKTCSRITGIPVSAIIFVMIAVV